MKNYSHESPDYTRSLIEGIRISIMHMRSGKKEWENLDKAIEVTKKFLKTNLDPSHRYSPPTFLYFPIKCIGLADNSKNLKIFLRLLKEYPENLSSLIFDKIPRKEFSEAVKFFLSENVKEVIKSKNLQDTIKLVELISCLYDTQSSHTDTSSLRFNIFPKKLANSFKDISELLNEAKNLGNEYKVYVILRYYAREDLEKFFRIVRILLAEIEFLMRKGKSKSDLIDLKYEKIISKKKKEFFYSYLKKLEELKRKYINKDSN